MEHSPDPTSSSTKRGTSRFGPTAKTLTTRGTIVSDDQVLYRASKFDRTPAPAGITVLSERAGSKIPRSIFEQSRDVVRSLVGTELYELVATGTQKD